MKDYLNIPERILVGYQDRDDCPSKKLAYVTYYRGKQIAKKASWESWRSKSIEPEEFENIPTSGFILNKRTGGCVGYSTWNKRITYCRVSDPRGFEFEIGLDNLLYILEHCDCLTGKGLEGKFVYSWDGSDLVLLPVTSPDYTETKKTEEKVATSGIKKWTDIEVGKKYRIKDGRDFLEAYYLGDLTWTIKKGGWLASSQKIDIEKHHTFYDPNDSTAYRIPDTGVKRIMYHIKTERDLRKDEVDQLIDRFKARPFGKAAIPSQMKLEEDTSTAIQELWEKIKNKDRSVVGMPITVGIQETPNKIKVFGGHIDHQPLSGLLFRRDVSYQYNLKSDGTFDYTEDRRWYDPGEPIAINKIIDNYVPLGDSSSFNPENSIKIFIGDTWFGYSYCLIPFERGYSYYTKI